jgi:hypothetical protein
MKFLEKRFEKYHVKHIERYSDRKYLTNANVDELIQYKFSINIPDVIDSLMMIF